MNFDRIMDLIETVDQSDLSEFSYQEGSFSLALFGPAGDPLFSAVESSGGEEEEAGLSSPERDDSGGEGEIIKIYSPMIGVFIGDKDDHSGPLVSAGDPVEEGQILCFIEAIQRRDEVRAPKDGVITGIHIANGESVEYGQEIFSLKVAGTDD